MQNPRNIIPRCASFLFFLLLLIVVFAWACRSSYAPPERKINLAAIYNPLASRIHPSYKVYHNSDNSSILYVKFFTSELLFVPTSTGSDNASKVSVEVQLFEKENDTLLLSDSITYEYTIKEKASGSRYYAQIPLKAVKGKNYQLKLTARDELRKSINIKFIDIEKQDVFSAQNFNLTNINNIPIFGTSFNPGTVFKVQHRFPNSEVLYVSYYKGGVVAPKTTYSANKSTTATVPDSTWEFKYSSDLALELYYEGRYLIRFDTSQSNGFILANYGASYPRVDNPVDMIPPLEYLTTDVELEKIKKQQNPKLAVDRFWMEIGNGTARGRELIRIYYSRVYFANYYFTSHVPGWATDMGMIYIIYGAPQKIVKYANREVWMYYYKSVDETIKFTYRYDPLAGNPENYTLQRSDNQDWRWRDAMIAWRNGEVFLQD